LNGYHLVQLLSQLDHALVVEVTGDVNKLVSRILDRLHNHGVAMPRGGNCNTGGKVNETMAVYIPYLTAPPVGHDKGIGTPIGLGNGLSIALHDIPAPGTGEYH